MQKDETKKTTWIISLSDVVAFPNGKVTNLAIKIGTKAEAIEFGERIAKKYGVQVRSIT